MTGADGQDPLYGLKCDTSGVVWEAGTWYLKREKMELYGAVNYDIIIPSHVTSIATEFFIISNYMAAVVDWLIDWLVVGSLKSARWIDWLIDLKIIEVWQWINSRMNLVNQAIKRQY